MPKRPLANLRPAQRLRPVYERLHSTPPVTPAGGQVQQAPAVAPAAVEAPTEPQPPAPKPVTTLRPVYERPAVEPATPPVAAPAVQTDFPAPVETAAAEAEAIAAFDAAAMPAGAAADTSPELEWLQGPAREDEGQLVLEHEPNIFSQALAIARREIPKKAWIVGGVIAGLLLLTIGVRAVLYNSSRTAATVHLPASVTSTLNFGAYYPKQIPVGYTYLEGSAANLAGELQFRLVKGNAEITVTEQPMPAGEAGTLGKMPGSAVISLIQGQARVNVDSSGIPEGLLITKNVRINVISNGNASTAEVTTVLENLWRQ